MTPAIDVRGLERRFGLRTAIAGVDLSVRPGEIHALLGPNGAGKTTLLRTLAGLVEPTAGTVHVAGVDVAKGPRALRGKVGFVPSNDRSAYQRISGVENLAFFARLHGMRKKPAYARARAVLADVGLGDRGDDAVGGWSHGMQQRLSVARALLTEPPVLLVDEATHDLDPEAAATVRELIAARAEAGTAVLWATQRLDELRGFAGEVTLLSAGAAAFHGTVEALASRAVPDSARRHASELEQGYMAIMRGAA
ncbi:ABC transporter ATP-binding protein [Solirubrobacter soli]|uniref:ABC transporter ATP-binding protein n=1 Tax=Solirubrobacter soli TaxID=363832 RepID=UPI00042870DB|nr:ABC transporter ATP-binding protein [Solirubrobacter soli]